MSATEYELKTRVKVNRGGSNWSSSTDSWVRLEIRIEVQRIKSDAADQWENALRLAAREFVAGRIIPPKATQ